MPGTVLGAGGNKMKKSECCPSQHLQINLEKQTQIHHMQGGNLMSGTNPEGGVILCVWRLV